MCTTAEQSHTSNILSSIAVFGIDSVQLRLEYAKCITLTIVTTMKGSINTDITSSMPNYYLFALSSEPPRTIVI